MYMKYVYKVTEELETSFRKKFLRFLRLENPREEFDIVLRNDVYNVGDVIINDSGNIKMKVVKKWKKMK